MNGHSMGTLNPRTLGMNHLDRGSAYTSLRSPSPPLTYYPYNRHGIYHQGHRSDLDNDISLMSSQFGQSHLDETSSEQTQSQIHFSKWCPTNPGNTNGEAQRSSSLSPKPTKPTVQLSYRPPTPQVSSQPTVHRGILKGQRPPSDPAAESPRGAISNQPKGFWDAVDLAGDVNGSYNSIASSHMVGDSMSRKTVRFADGKPAMSNRSMQVSLDGVRSPTVRSNGILTQGVYEWEPSDSLAYTSRVTGDLHKPPRPPKPRPSMRVERRVITNQFFPDLDGGSAVGVPTSPLPGSASLRNFEGPLTFTNDNYANYESIYENRRFPDGSMGEVERIDSQRLDALMKPFMTSNNPESTLNVTSTPPIVLPNSIGVAVTSTPIYRTEVTHSTSNGGTFAGLQNNSLTSNELLTTQLPRSAPTSPPFKSTPPTSTQFVYTIKPTLVESDNDGTLNSLDDSTTAENVTLKPRSPQNLPSTPLTPRILGTLAGTPPLSMPGAINDRQLTMPTRGLNSRRPSEVQQIPIMTQAQPQSKRHQPLRVDVDQTKTASLADGKFLMSPLQGPPFTDSPRRRGLLGGPQLPSPSADRKTGSLDRDGVWRPNRFRLPLNNTNGFSVGSASPIAQGLAYPPSAYFNDLMNSGGNPRTDRRRMWTAPRLSPFGTSIGGVTTEGGGGGGGGMLGGVEVPIIVLPSTATSTNTAPLATSSTPSSSSAAFRHRPMSPNASELRRGINAKNVLIRKM